jgi:hypothetical protein
MDPRLGSRCHNHYALSNYSIEEESSYSDQQGGTLIEPGCQQKKLDAQKIFHNRLKHIYYEAISKPK